MPLFCRLICGKWPVKFYISLFYVVLCQKTILFSVIFPCFYNRLAHTGHDYLSGAPDLHQMADYGKLCYCVLVNLSV